MGLGELGFEADRLLVIFAGQLLAERLTQGLLQEAAGFLTGRASESVGFEPNFTGRRH